MYRPAFVQQGYNELVNSLFPKRVETTFSTFEKKWFLNQKLYVHVCKECCKICDNFLSNVWSCYFPEIANGIEYSDANIPF